MYEEQKDTSNWEDYNNELIKRAFNNIHSEYYYAYSRLNTMAGVMDALSRVDTSSLTYNLRLSKQCISNSVTWLKRLVEKLPLIEEDASISQYISKDRTYYNRGFIIHGHDESKKFEVARFIENDLKRKAIILHEQPNKGKTIIEKFESHSTVDFAEAIWTADDEGQSKTEQVSRARARQNVIFETGFFIGTLGRQNVIVLYEHGVEIPSDYSGVIFIPLENNWKDDLRKEIDAIYQIA